MSEIPPEWELSPAQELSIFHNEIVPRELLPHIPNDGKANITTTTRTPIVIIIAGQTGAGKTRLAPILLQALAELTSHSSQLRPAHLIADTYKTYHPAYRSLLSPHPSATNPLPENTGPRPGIGLLLPQATRLASPSARRWLALSARHAASRRIPILIESACRHTEDFIELARIFQSPSSMQPYKVAVAVLAVPAALSRLGILTRYHHGREGRGSDEQVEVKAAMDGEREGTGRVGDDRNRDRDMYGDRGMPLRLTPRSVHDESFAGLGEVVRWVDGEEGRRVVDGIVVVRRGGGVGYWNRRRRTGWENEVGALRALIAERSRGLLVEERETARKDLEMLRGLGDPKVDEQIREIEELLAGLGDGGDGIGVEPYPALEMLDAVGFLKELLE